VVGGLERLAVIAQEKERERRPDRHNLHQLYDPLNNCTITLKFSLEDLCMMRRFGSIHQ
jgi:hypothetical protein